MCAASSVHWLALEDTDHRPGADDSGWRLVVKAGRDARKEKEPTLK